MIRFGLVALFAMLCVSCGKEDTPASNNNTSANTCDTKEDCPADDSITFLDEANLECESDVNGRGYCSECLLDADCGEGFNCNNATFCEELKTCQTSRDCIEGDELVHDACINNGCQACTDHPDCDEVGGEMCFNRLCVPRANVDQECIDGNCGENGFGTCPVREEDGVPTGFMCVP